MSTKHHPAEITKRGLVCLGVGGGANDAGGFSARWITDGTGFTLRKATFFRMKGPVVNHGDQAFVAVRRGDLLHEAYGTGPLSLTNPEATVVSWRVIRVDPAGWEVVLQPLFAFRGVRIPESVAHGASLVDNEDGSLFVAPRCSDAQLRDELDLIMAAAEE